MTANATPLSMVLVLVTNAMAWPQAHTQQITSQTSDKEVN